MCMCYIKEQIKNQDDIMGLKNDMKACDNPVDNDPMCEDCERAFPKERHMLYSNFGARFINGKIDACSGYIERDTDEKD